jgi:altronate dehydratase
VNPVIVISTADNVATTLEALEPGRVIPREGGPLSVLEAIPRGHKIAIAAIAPGEAVIKYGSSIGTATAHIAAGAHVHTHNVSSTRGRGDLVSAEPAVPARLAEPEDRRDA